MRGRAAFGNLENAVWKPSPGVLERSRLAAAMKRWGYDFSGRAPSGLGRQARVVLACSAGGSRHHIRDTLDGRFGRVRWAGISTLVSWRKTEYCDSLRGPSRRSTGARDKPAVIYEGDAGARRVAHLWRARRRKSNALRAACSTSV